ncbi:MAG: hypothetical protein JSV44_11940 [Candidatus Zixiibacteriota bacterium]|nr:MAG: hypothetical protein JSV44_11940 [candidate division Zixibacteria bacterium]
MKRIALAAFVLLLYGPAVFSQLAETFDRAKVLSREQGKPILLEFVHED